MKLGRSILAAERRMALLFGVCLVSSMPLAAQTETPTTKPYATLDRQSVTYQGPAVTADKPLPDGPAVIGMIVPLRGAQEAEGKTLLAAAQIALEEEQARGPLPDGRKLALAVRDESGQWGQASSEILKLIEQDHALAVITSANGGTAHEAEQIATKISFPILTLASDSSTTETNVPWLFRLGPSDTDQARMIARRITEMPGLRKVLLVVQMDHDGRVGGEQFEKAAREKKLAGVERVELAADGKDVASISATLRSGAPEAVVVWADTMPARRVVEMAQQAAPGARVYLCSKAAQLGANGSEGLGEYFTVAGPVRIPDDKFAEEYRKRTGSEPGIAAIEAYEAAHLVAAGIRSRGTSRVLLREYFAETGKAREQEGALAFDPAGNQIGEFRVVRVGSGGMVVAGQ